MGRKRIFNDPRTGYYLCIVRNKFVSLQRFVLFELFKVKQQKILRIISGDFLFLMLIIICILAQLFVYCIMDPISWDALKAREQIINLADINRDKDYFVLGHYDNRRSSYQWTDYPLYLVKASDILGQVNFVDKQKANSNTTFQTLLSTYIDVPFMTLTTQELGGPTPGALGNYQIHFSASYQLSDIGSSAEFILNIDGLDILPTEVIESPNNTGIYRTSIIWQVDSLPANKTIKVKFKIIPTTPTVSTLTVFNRVLMIDGANTLNVI